MIDHKGIYVSTVKEQPLRNLSSKFSSFLVVDHSRPCNTAGARSFAVIRIGLGVNRILDLFKHSVLDVHLCNIQFIVRIIDASHRNYLRPLEPLAGIDNPPYHSKEQWRSIAKARPIHCGCAGSY